MRLQKFLAQAGCGSRRESEQFILDSRVRVNGHVVTTLGTKIDPDTDQIYLDEVEIALPQQFDYILLNKPPGYIVTRKDTHGRKTVYDLLPQNLHTLHPVGRLDQDSCGLLLFTNDGQLTQRLMHPSQKVAKTYEVIVEGKVSTKMLKRLNRPMQIHQEWMRAETVRILKRSQKGARLCFVLKEGKNRQIRKMCAAVGLKVTFLKRTFLGNMGLGALHEGQYRKISSAELALFQ